MIVNEISANNMSIDKIIVNEMSVDDMSAENIK